MHERYANGASKFSLLFETLLKFFYIMSLGQSDVKSVKEKL